MPRHIEDDDDDVVKDGEGIYVPLQLCDSVQRRALGFNPRDHQPGFRDADRCRKAYADYCRDAGLPDPDADVNQKAPYENFKASLSNAWKGQPRWNAPPSDVELAERVASLLRLAPPKATASSAPLPGWTRGSDGADARRSARNEYVKKLGDAWKTPVARDGVVAIEEPDDLVKAIEMAIARELEGDGKSDPKAAVKIEKQLEGWQGHSIEQLAAAAETRRKATHAKFSQDLSSAWRGK